MIFIKDWNQIKFVVLLQLNFKNFTKFGIPIQLQILDKICNYLNHNFKFQDEKQLINKKL